MQLQNVDLVATAGKGGCVTQTKLVWCFLTASKTPWNPILKMKPSCHSRVGTLLAHGSCCLSLNTIGHLKRGKSPFLSYSDNTCFLYHLCRNTFSYCLLRQQAVHLRKRSQDRRDCFLKFVFCLWHAASLQPSLPSLH